MNRIEQNLVCGDIGPVLNTLWMALYNLPTEFILMYKLNSNGL